MYSLNISPLIFQDLSFLQLWSMTKSDSRKSVTEEWSRYRRTSTTNNQFDKLVCPLITCYQISLGMNTFRVCNSFFINIDVILFRHTFVNTDLYKCGGNQIEPIIEKQLFLFGKMFPGCYFGLCIQLCPVPCWNSCYNSDITQVTLNHTNTEPEVFYLWWGFWPSLYCLDSFQMF